MIRDLGIEPSPHQILIENLTYEDFAGFMNTKEKKTLVPKDLAIEWSLSKGVPQKARRGRNKKQSNDEEDGTRADTAEAEVEGEMGDNNDGGEDGGDDGGEKVEVLIPLSLSVYTNVQSSISFLYKECRVQMPVTIQSRIGKYIKGMKRISRQMKQHLALKIVEGKRVMTRDVYHFISRVLLESNEKGHIFARLFFALDWYVTMSF